MIYLVPRNKRDINYWFRRVDKPQSPPIRLQGHGPLITKYFRKKVTKISVVIPPIDKVIPRELRVQGSIHVGKSSSLKSTHGKPVLLSLGRSPRVFRTSPWIVPGCSNYTPEISSDSDLSDVLPSLERYFSQASSSSRSAIHSSRTPVRMNNNPASSSPTTIHMSPMTPRMASPPWGADFTPPQDEFIRNHHHLIHPLTGKIFSLRMPTTRYPGYREVMGSLNSRGYLQVTVGDRKILKHRYIWEQFAKLELLPGMQIDHKNGNKLDNRIENLQVVNNTLNNQNKSRRKDSQCRYKGVQKRKNGTYAASITIFGQVLRREGFTSEKDAALWYDEQAWEANHLQKCRFQLNFPDRRRNIPVLINEYRWD